jgi:hypothetical protein
MAAGAHIVLLELPSAAGAAPREPDTDRKAGSPPGTSPMKCPICGQVVVKSRKAGPGALWIRCITDGDFTIAENAVSFLADLPIATRHLVLNLAIVDRQLEAPPFIDDTIVMKGCIKAEEIAASSNGG